MAKPKVVVLPGFMGSTLSRVNQGFNLSDVWYSPAALTVDGPDPLELAADGLAPGPLADGPLKANGMVDLGIYEPLMTQLANDGFDATFYDYDWRKSLDVNAPAFVAFLRTFYKSDPFTVLAHSAGGLVALLARAAYNLQGAHDQWTRTVAMGVPYGGSYEANKALMGNPYDSAWMTLLIQSVGGGLRYVRHPLSDKRPALLRTIQVIASWPFVYELMASNYGPWAGRDDELPIFDNQATYANFNPYVTQARLDSGKAMRIRIAALMDNPGGATTILVNTGKVTKNHVAQVDQLDLAAGYSTTKTGDGTVAVGRGKTPLDNVITMTGDHYSYTQNGQQLGQLKALLTSPLPVSKEIAPVVEPIDAGPLQIFPGKVPVPNYPWKQLVTYGDP